LKQVLKKKILSVAYPRMKIVWQHR